MDINSTYVYQNIEVKLTGRIAVKQIKSIRSTQQDKQSTVYEITPVDKDQEWAKWVKAEELFIVTQLSEDDA